MQDEARVMSVCVAGRALMEVDGGGSSGLG